MKTKLFCTQCKDILGYVDTDNFDIDFYRKTMRCDHNHTDDIEVEIDGDTVTQQVGSIDYQVIEKDYE